MQHANLTEAWPCSESHLPGYVTTLCSLWLVCVDISGEMIQSLDQVFDAILCVSYIGADCKGVRKTQLQWIQTKSLKMRSLVSALNEYNPCYDITFTNSFIRFKGNWAVQINNDEFSRRSSNSCIATLIPSNKSSIAGLSHEQSNNMWETYVEIDLLQTYFHTGFGFLVCWIF